MFIVITYSLSSLSLSLTLTLAIMALCLSAQSPLSQLNVCTSLSALSVCALSVLN